MATEEQTPLDREIELSRDVGPQPESQPVAKQQGAEHGSASSEECYRSLVELSPTMIAVHDSRFLYINQAGVHLLGAANADEIVGTPALESIHPEDREVARAYAEQALREGKPTPWVEQKLLRRDGSVVEVEALWTPILHEGRQELVVHVREITARKEIERAMQRQQRLLDAIFDNILAHVAYMDRDFNIVRVNATYAQGSGHTVEELIGRNHFVLFPNEDNQRIFERVRDTGQEYIARAKPFIYADQPERGVTYWDWWLRPIAGPMGEIEGLVLSLVDVTSAERGRREVERLNAELQEVNATKDQFLAVLSHELRNPLAPILAGVLTLRQRMPDDERIRRTLQIIERNVKLQTRLVDDLLDLSRIARGQLQFHHAHVLLDRVVKAAVEDQQGEAQKAGLSMKVDTTPGLTVIGDFGRLQQAVLNLLTNAIKFSQRGGHIHVMTHAPDAQHARIVVEDTGIGIAPALIDRIFEMFRQGAAVAGHQRTGMGIGLALVKSIIEQHNGRVWAESEGPGKGSRFTIELPLVSDSSQSEAAQGGETPHLSTETIPE
jgi:PAS domain S-box-containing protein